MNYLIDIDGTICDDIPNEQPQLMVTAQAYECTADIINKWYNEGNTITFFTSRLEEHRKVTEEWLQRNGFKYHSIIFGKPRGGKYYFIDNHFINGCKSIDEALFNQFL